MSGSAARQEALMDRVAAGLRMAKERAQPDEATASGADAWGRLRRFEATYRVIDITVRSRCGFPDLTDRPRRGDDQWRCGRAATRWSRAAAPACHPQSPDILLDEAPRAVSRWICAWISAVSATRTRPDVPLSSRVTIRGRALPRFGLAKMPQQPIEECSRPILVGRVDDHCRRFIDRNQVVIFIKNREPIGSGSGGGRRAPAEPSRD